MGNAALVADALDAEDDIVGVFLESVIDRGFEIGLRAVVVDAQAAADIQKLEAGADAVQLNIHAGGFRQSILDAADIGDLAAQMKVNELQTVGHAALLEDIRKHRGFR